MVRSDLLNMADLVPARRRCYLWDGQRADRKKGLDCHRLVATQNSSARHAGRDEERLLSFIFPPKTWFGSTHEKSPELRLNG
jgi:hypothetical protein